jgi:hypothetical protein
MLLLKTRRRTRLTNRRRILALKQFSRTSNARVLMLKRATDVVAVSAETAASAVHFLMW